ncbi:hypothetical protein B1B04_13195 [Lysinibacillus sp. KCTC 33748]|uniref:hypothetical protein n=1 Tax=unclassified Lysinibacillus TaxID=2636778 RepID=UPI0009A61D7A|nr:MULTISPECIES: hypothetical protein [unclassified Lysinibacillus]OXS73235.1 hypothetical protein B1B04_13195 [Lysinibacillus sp. KCTC 33748]SKB83059.1 hypothetical protein SAMN06295926_10995 [Lysinibacillus sp. AC-3]
MGLEKVQFPYTYLHLQRHFLLEGDTKINTWKNFLIVAIPIFAFIFNFLRIKDGFSNSSYSKLASSEFDYKKLASSEYVYENLGDISFIPYLLVGFIFTFLMSLGVHFLAYYRILRSRDETSLSTEAIFKTVFDNFNKRDILKIFISPDLAMAQYCKNLIVNDIKSIEFNTSDTDIYLDREHRLSSYHWSLIRIEKKAFIEFSNWLNIILTTILFVVTYFIFDIATYWILAIIIYRILSRGTEIVVAFYYDVVQVNSKQFYLGKDEEYINGFTSSLIRQSGRLSLAIHSLIEMIFIFAIAYFVYFQVITSLSLTTDFVTCTISDNCIIKKEDAPTLFETLLMSSTLGVFNISYGVFPNILLAILHAFQILISGVLILLSVAQYLGADKTLNISDEKFYNEIANLDSLKENGTNSLYELNNIFTTYIKMTEIKYKINIGDNLKKNIQYIDSNIYSRH